MDAMTTELVNVRPDFKPAMLRPIAKPAELMEAHTETVHFLREVLKENVDFGKIPGAGDRKTLFKAGAERVCAGFGLRAEYEVIESECDHNREIPYSLVKWVAAGRKPGRDDEARLKAEGTHRNKKTRDGWEWQEKVAEEGFALGLYRYVVRCRLYLGEREVGQGVGSCSSLESKYIRAPRDAENTILKIAKKRAHVDSVLTTVGLSDRFTQDVEDIRANAAARGENIEAETIDAEFVEEVPSDADLKERALNKEANALMTRWDMGNQTRAEWKSFCDARNLPPRDTLLAASRVEGVRDIQDAYAWAEAKFPISSEGAQFDPETATPTEEEP